MSRKSKIDFNGEVNHRVTRFFDKLKITFTDDSGKTINVYMTDDEARLFNKAMENALFKYQTTTIKVGEDSIKVSAEKHGLVCIEFI